MSTIEGFPHKYPRPTVGQPYRREQQDGKWEFGQIIGIKSVSVKRPVLVDGQPKKDADGKVVEAEVEVAWQAHLSTGFCEFRTVVAHDTTYTSTEDWHPVPAAEAGAAETALITALTERVRKIEGLVERLASDRGDGEPVVRNGAPVRPSRSAAAG